MRALGLKAMPLGLDLRGGLYLLYQVDVNGAVSQLLESYEQSFRRTLIDAKLPFTDITNITSGQSTIPNGLSVRVPTLAAATAVQAALTKLDNTLSFTVQTSPPARGEHGADADPDQGARGLRARAEPHHAEEPRQRAGRVRADRAAPGPRSHQRAAAGRAELGRGEGSARQGRDARVPPGRQNANPIEAQQSGRAPLGAKLYKMQGRHADPAQARGDRHGR